MPIFSHHGPLSLYTSQTWTAAWKQLYGAIDITQHTLYLFNTEAHYQQERAHAKDAKTINIQDIDVYRSHSTDRPYVFELLSTTNVDYFAAETFEQLRTWIRVLLQTGARGIAPYRQLIVQLDTHSTTTTAASSSAQTNTNTQTRINTSLTVPGSPPSDAASVPAPAAAHSVSFSWSLVPTNCLGKHGYLQKHGVFNSSFQTKFFRTLIDTHNGSPTLCYYTNHYVSSTHVDGSVLLSGAGVAHVTDDEDDCDFSVSTEKRVYIFRAPSVGDKQQWMQILHILARAQLNSTTQKHMLQDEQRLDFYGRLGCSINSHEDDILQAYRTKKLSLLADKQDMYMKMVQSTTVGDTATVLTLAELEEAHEVLSNVIRRVEYDELIQMIHMLRLMVKRSIPPIMQQSQPTPTQVQMEAAVNGTELKYDEYGHEHKHESHVSLGGDDYDPSLSPAIVIDRAPSAVSTGNISAAGYIDSNISATNSVWMPHEHGWERQVSQS